MGDRDNEVRDYHGGCDTMRKTVRILPVVFLVLFVASAGCVGTPVTFKSQANVDYDATKGRPLSRSACGFQLWSFIPIKINSRLYRAYNEVLADAGPRSYVTDIQVGERWRWAYIGTIYCTEIHATAYPLKAVRTESTKLTK